MEAGQSEIKADMARLGESQLQMKSRDKKNCLFSTEAPWACIHVNEYHLFSNKSLEQLEQMINWRVIMCCNKMLEGSRVSSVSWCLQTKPLLENKLWQDRSYQLQCWVSWGVLPYLTGEILLTLRPDGLFSEEVTWIRYYGPMLNPLWFLCCLVEGGSRSQISKSNC